MRVWFDYINDFKGTVGVNISDPPFKEGYA